MFLKRAIALVLLGLLVACGSSPLAPTATPVLPPLTATAAPSTLTALSPAATRAAAPTRSPTSTKPPIVTPEWFNDVALYEIFPRSFEDSSGDGVGDLKGITAKLDYLKDLGVGAIWLTPIFASPSYHGYDTTDYYAINPDFGTEQDLIDLVNAAHARDIKVILDFVAGHTSDEHPFFKDAYNNPQSRYSDWYRWLDDAHTKYQYFGAAPSMPQLNQDNPATRDYLIGVAKYWMDKAKVDGYRLDFAKNISHDFWKAFRQELKAINPDVLLLGEIWDGAVKIAPYYNELDATFDFPVYFDLMGSADRAGTSPLLAQTTPSLFESTLPALTRLYPPGAQSVRFINNHDTVRAASQLDGNLEREKLAATLLLTLPGTPMVYYGEEIGMLGDKRDGDKSVREPMDWYAAESGAGMTTWYKPDARLNQPNDGISVEEETGKNDSLLETYRRLIALRNDSRTLRRGDFAPVPVHGTDKAIAFTRSLDGEHWLVAANAADEPMQAQLDLSALGMDRVTLVDALVNTNLSAMPARNVMLTLPPRSAFVFRVNQTAP